MAFNCFGSLNIFVAVVVAVGHSEAVAGAITTIANQRINHTSHLVHSRHIRICHTDMIRQWIWWIRAAGAAAHIEIIRIKISNRTGTKQLHHLIHTIMVNAWCRLWLGKYWDRVRLPSHTCRMHMVFINIFYIIHFYYYEIDTIFFYCCDVLLCILW